MSSDSKKHKEWRACLVSALALVPASVFYLTPVKEAVCFPSLQKLLFLRKCQPLSSVSLRSLVSVHTPPLLPVPAHLPTYKS